jgi:hypothetical protein
MRYPVETGFVHGSPTSQASARELDDSGSAKNQSMAILAFLGERQHFGATADELTIHLKRTGFPTIHNGTVAGRLVHLELLGDIAKTASTRATMSGRMANIYVAAAFRAHFKIMKTTGIGQIRSRLKAILAALDGGEDVRIMRHGELHLLLRDYFTHQKPLKG